mmetsp:Transcript_26545/g.68540  ORF Transcript_26545/g.68540 Transcript_26545/m.68540 type:complete len:239 (+) Transcript_26545:124-840(+)
MRRRRSGRRTMPAARARTVAAAARRSSIRASSCVVHVTSSARARSTSTMRSSSNSSRPLPVWGLEEASTHHRPSPRTGRKNQLSLLLPGQSLPRPTRSRFGATDSPSTTVRCAGLTTRRTRNFWRISTAVKSPASSRRLRAVRALARVVALRCHCVLASHACPPCPTRTARRGRHRRALHRQEHGGIHTSAANRHALRGRRPHHARRLSARRHWWARDTAGGSCGRVCADDVRAAPTA